MASSLIVALDAPLDRAVDLYKCLRQTGCAFKIGVSFLLELRGRQIAREIVQNGHRLMLDLKLYDTRDTVLRTMEAAEKLGAHMVTIHEDCVAHAIGCRSATAVLAVGPLTDGGGSPSYPAVDGPFDGLICSVFFAAAIRKHTDKLLVCPGIRPFSYPANNHSMSATPAQARDAGADYIVVGRPIIGAVDPARAALGIMAEIAT
jgi:orotidine-5'-phosphate decarboxylase